MSDVEALDLNDLNGIAEEEILKAEELIATATPPDEELCEGALKEVGEMEDRRRTLHTTLKLRFMTLGYPEDEPYDFVTRLWSRLEEGELKSKPGQICDKFGRRCVDAGKLLSDLREYMSLTAKSRRRVLDVAYLCRDVTPPACEEEIRELVEDLDRLWSFPVNPNRAMRDLTELAEEEPERFKEALEAWLDFRYDSYRVRRCALRWVRGEEIL